MFWEILTLMAITLTILVTKKMTPLSMSIMVVISSLLLSLYTFLLLSNLVLPLAILVSFSSGMLFIFCYCSIFTNSETKEMKKSMMIIIFVFTLMVMMKKPLPPLTPLTNYENPPIILCMAFLVLSTITINKLFSKSTKNLLNTL